MTMVEPDRKIGLSAQEWEERAISASKLAFAAAYRVTLNVLDAEDAAQESMLKMWLGRHKIRGGNFNSLAAEVARNEGIDTVRYNSRRNGPRMDLEGVSFQIRDTNPNTNPEQAALEREGTNWAFSLIAILPESQRLIVTLCSLYQLPQREVADRINETRGTVKSRNFKGLRALRAHLERPDQTP